MLHVNKMSPTVMFYCMHACGTELMLHVTNYDKFALYHLPTKHASFVLLSQSKAQTFI